jgi:hypothetical protein
MNWLLSVSYLCLLAAFSASISAADKSEPPPLLRQTVTLEFDNLTLDQCAERLRVLTKRDVVVHPSLRPLLEARERKLRMDEETLADPLAPGGISLDVMQAPGFSCTLRQLPLHSALRTFLEHYGLGYAVVDGAIVVATADKAGQLRREQPAPLQLDNVPLAKVLEALSQQHGVALVIDAKLAAAAKTPITVQAREVTLEEAVMLLADSANLKAAPLQSGWVLTSADRASAWLDLARRRAEAAKASNVTYPAPSSVNQFPGGIGGAVPSAEVALEPVELPRALLQTAGPPIRATQAVEKVERAVPLPKAVEIKKSLAAETLRKMNEPFNFTEDAPLTMRDAIKTMEELGFPRIVIHQAVFKDEDPDAVDLHETQVRWPGKGLSRAKTLRLLLDQFPSNNATYLVRPGYVEIVTIDSARPNRQFIQASFQQRPLDEALHELSEQSGLSIVVDPRVGDRARMPVTVRFPADTNLAQAVRLLADMADLKALMVDATMYVTSRSNAIVFPEEPLGRGRHTLRDAQ